MAEGPKGRLVAELCPGESPLPLPIDRMHAVGQNLLPTLKVFSSPLRDQALDASITPHQDPTALASLGAFDRLLTRNIEQFEARESQRTLPDSPVALNEPNVLEWAPTPSTR